jgi:uncharacterized protein YhfF
MMLTMAFPVVDSLRSIEFGTPGESRARLVNFIINGNKRATAGLLHDYTKEGELVEHVGECLAMVDNDGKHVATLRVTRVEITRFADVPDEFALAEAEGDLNASDFRASHLEYWTRAGEVITDDTQVVQVYFDLRCNGRNLRAPSMIAHRMVQSSRCGKSLHPTNHLRVRYGNSGRSRLR